MLPIAGCQPVEKCDGWDDICHNISIEMNCQSLSYDQQNDQDARAYYTDERIKTLSPSERRQALSDRELRATWIARRQARMQELHCEKTSP